MIPFDYITEWRGQAPWIEDSQVEQDLVISRAMAEIFANPVLANSLALRGGTALSKLHVRPPARYSEDIDLVQTTAEPAGRMMEALRARRTARQQVRAPCQKVIPAPARRSKGTLH